MLDHRARIEPAVDCPFPCLEQHGSLGPVGQLDRGHRHAGCPGDIGEGRAHVAADGEQPVRSVSDLGAWLRRLHDATASFVPPEDTAWFAGQSWRPGLVIGHHDAAPYNVVWRGERLVGFVDWDIAGPSSPELDLAFVALTWVPMQARRVAAEQGFVAFDDRSRRLHLLLDAYRYDGDRAAFGAAIAGRARVNAAGIDRLAGGGDPMYVGLLSVVTDLEEAAREVEALPPSF
ncbi:MAG: phosphotransferase [Pseudonocardiales bacterium]|nr:phosphotransferase [Pseudonocardiales bacterium]